MTPDQLTLQELTLKERVRRFNLGTPTAMHVCTHELVNDLWRELEMALAALQGIIACDDTHELAPSCDNMHGFDDVKTTMDLARAAIAKATGT